MILLWMSKNALEGGKAPIKRTVHQRNAEIRTTRRNRSKIYLGKVFDDYGKYFLFDNIPYHLMGKMITEFRYYEFDHKYDKQCSNIFAGNTLLPEGQKSTYWMFENESHARKKVIGLLIYN